VMEHGEIVQIGTPTEIYERPRSRFVSDFIGVSNILEGKVVARDAAALVVELPSGVRVSAAPVAGPATGDRIEVAVRPEKIRLSEAVDGSVNSLAGTIANVVYLGAVSYSYVQTADTRLVVMEQNRAPRPASAPSPIGRTVHACWDVASTLVLASRP